jgi:hypothetical protein
MSVPRPETFYAGCWSLARRAASLEPGPAAHFRTAVPSRGEARGGSKWCASNRLIPVCLSAGHVVGQTQCEAQENPVRKDGRCPSDCSTILAHTAASSSFGDTRFSVDIDDPKQKKFDACEGEVCGGYVACIVSYHILCKIELYRSLRERTTRMLERTHRQLFRIANRMNSKDCNTTQSHRHLHKCIQFIHARTT